MSDNTHDNLEIVGRHVPDAMVDAQGNPASPLALGYDTPSPVTGTYQIGVMIEGAFIPIISEKASLVFDRIDVAKHQAAEQQASQQQSQPDSGSSMQTGEQSQQQQQSQPETGPQSGQAAPPAGQQPQS